MKDHRELIDEYVPKVMWTVFGVNSKIGKVATGKVRAFLKETLDDAATETLYNFQ